MVKEMVLFDAIDLNHKYHFEDDVTDAMQEWQQIRMFFSFEGVHVSEFTF